MRSFKEIIAVLFIVCTPLFARAQAGDAEIAAALERREFKFEATWANPMSSRSVNLSSGYTLVVDGTQARASLPFFGRAYSVPYNGDGGISFDMEEMEDYESEQVRKRKSSKTEITFKVRASGDLFHFRLEVFAGGEASLSVNSANRSPISYRGNVVPLEKD